jgi:hypothetical protein
MRFAAGLICALGIFSAAAMAQSAIKIIVILAADTASRVVEIAAIHVQTNARAG